MNDRFDSKIFGKERKIEDLKERTYWIYKLTYSSILELNDYFYDKKKEEVRKMGTERYMTRNSIINKREEELLNSIKNMNLKIIKREKEESEIRNMLNITCDGIRNEIKEDNFNTLQSVEDLLKSFSLKNSFLSNNTKRIAFNRGSLITFTVPNVSPLLNKKLTNALENMKLEGLNVSNQINHDLIDKIKKNFIHLFILKAYLEKKKDELKKLKEIENEKMPMLGKRSY